MWSNLSQQDCQAKQITLEDLGNQQGIGETVTGSVDGGVVDDEVLHNQKRTYAQILKEANFKALFTAQQEQKRKDQENRVAQLTQVQQRRKEKADKANKEKATLNECKSKFSVNTQTTKENMNADNQENDKVEKELGEVTRVVGGVEMYVSRDNYDWAEATAVDPNDPLFKEHLRIKQKISEDFNLGSSNEDSDQTDEDDDITIDSHSKRCLSSPGEPSPNKQLKPFESPPPGQHG